MSKFRFEYWIKNKGHIVLYFTEILLLKSLEIFEDNLLSKTFSCLIIGYILFLIKKALDFWVTYRQHNYYFLIILLNT